MPKTVAGVLIWGGVLTGFTVGALTATVQNKWIYVPTVVAGIAATIVFTFRHWETRPYQHEVRQLLSYEKTYLLLFLLIASLPLQAIGIAILAITFVQAGTHPCICLSDSRGNNWINLMAGAGDGAVLENIILATSLIVIYRLIRGQST